MKTVRVTALKDHVYAEEPRQEGDTYEMDEKFLDLWLRLKNVKLAEVDEPPKTEPVGKGRYQRRDMRAQK